MKTIFVIGSKKHTLKYTRKMPEGEVKKMKSFVTNKGQKLEKTSKFKILKVSEEKSYPLRSTNKANCLETMKIEFSCKQYLC